MSDVRAFYFGCAKAADAGHFVFAEDPGIGMPRRRLSAREFIPDLPASMEHVDCQFTPRVNRRQGCAALANRDGWTILAWHDYTGDSRPGSNSVLVAEGEHDFAAMMGLLAKRFPSVLARQTVSIGLSV